eukprot:CAMPEP_0172589926 /NCGR_PEP_ID=MMETSP1068-20121228/8449_1 /TAXON_ID=35684 /ORGANISM="Pseudopedinella elastica, Strain CCMP716" /LENGTH=1114 /DNA_ID=CAMNT_0013385597 /DNA_START=196 /DNA_END=3540 /DNA_ORIENTATION=-
MPTLVAENLSVENFHKLKAEAGSAPDPMETTAEKTEAMEGAHEFLEPSFGHPYIDRKLDGYCKTIVKRPWTSLCSCYLILFVTIFVGLFGSGVIIVPSGFYEWYVKDDPSSIHADMLESARTNDLITNTTERSTVSFYQLFMYENQKEGSVFTPSNLQSMCEFEKSFYDFKMLAKDSKSISDFAPAGWLDQDICPTVLDYKDYCLLNPHTKNCTVPSTDPYSWSGALSVVYMFYGAGLVTPGGGWDCKLLDQATVDATANQLAAEVKSEAGQMAYGFFMDKHSPSKGYSKLTRSAIAVAGPLCLASGGEAGAGKCFDFASGGTDLFSDQSLSYSNNLLGPWTVDALAPEYKLKDEFQHPFFFDDIKGGSMEMYTFSLLLQNWESQRLLATDQYMVVFSLAFVYLWLFMHTQSLFIASVGISQIFLSIPASIFPYAMILQVKYFGLMQFLTIFIILGVGADDVFVLMDAWRQSAAAVPEQASEEATLVLRLKYAMVRTTQAVFNTSFTTSAAFFATAVSPIMPIATFGIFSACVILMNYLLVLTLTPCAILVNERSETKGCKPCGCCCAPGCGFGQRGCGCSPPSAAASGAGEAADSKAGFAGGSELELGGLENGVNVEVGGGPSGNPTDSADASPPPKGDAQIGGSEGFFRATLLPAYLKAVRHKPFALGLIMVLTGVMVAGAVLASQLEPPLETEKWMPSNHMLEEAFDLNGEYLSGASDQYAKLHVVWGMQGLDERDYNKYDPPCSCTKKTGCTGWEYSPPTCRGTVKYDAAFDVFAPATQTVIKDTCSSLASWPCDAPKCDYGLLIRPNTTVCFLNLFESWAAGAKGVDVAAWVGDEAKRADYMGYLMEFRSTDSSLDQVIGFTDKRDFAQGPSYVQIQALMTMPLLTPLASKYAIEDAANKFIKSVPTPPTARHVFQWTFDWVWSVTQAGTVSGLTTGMAIAFPIAFIALILATQNWILSVFACVSVGGIVASVLGFCKLQGWALGTGEAIAGVMVIGLSVDYTIHLAHMYDHAGHELGASDRDTRFGYSVAAMSGTVLGGAITTCGAGCFMFLCVQVFFFKMATLIVATIVFSVVYALFWFMPLVAHFGPEGKQGHLDFGAMKNAVCGK